MDRDVKLRWVSSISRTTNIYIISYCLPKVETNIGTTYVHVTHSNLAFICREGWNCLTSLQTPWDTYKYMRQSLNACGTLNCKVFYLDDWSNWTLSFFFFSFFLFLKNKKILNNFSFFLFLGVLGGAMHALIYYLNLYCIQQFGGEEEEEVCVTHESKTIHGDMRTSFFLVQLYISLALQLYISLEITVDLDGPQLSNNC